MSDGSGSGWIKHDGKMRPVGPTTFVDLRFRDGVVLEERLPIGWRWAWSKTEKYSDVMEYRVPRMAALADDYSPESDEIAPPRGCTFEVVLAAGLTMHLPHGSIVRVVKMPDQGCSDHLDLEPADDVICGRDKIAHMLGISIKTLSRRLKEGHFPEIFRFGPNRSELRITREDLQSIRRRGIGSAAAQASS